MFLYLLEMFKIFMAEIHCQSVHIEQFPLHAALTYIVRSTASDTSDYTVLY